MQTTAHKQNDERDETDRIIVLLIHQLNTLRIALCHAQTAEEREDVTEQLKLLLDQFRGAV